jgi:hypothetical protein
MDAMRHSNPPAMMAAMVPASAPWKSMRSLAACSSAPPAVGGAVSEGVVAGEGV